MAPLTDRKRIAVATPHMDIRCAGGGSDRVESTTVSEALDQLARSQGWNGLLKPRNVFSEIRRCT